MIGSSKVMVVKLNQFFTKRYDIYEVTKFAGQQVLVTSRL